MPPTSSMRSDPASPLDDPAGAGRLPSAVATAATALAGAAGLQLGGWEGLAVVVVTLGLLGTWLSGQRGSASQSRTGTGAGAGATRNQVVARLTEPVVSRWQQLLGNTQRATHQHQRQLDARIVHIIQQLESTLNLHATAAAAAPLTDELMERHRKVLDTLLHHSRSTARLRHDTLDFARTMTEALEALSALAREVQTISRATHLLALNASVEATRAGERGGGFAVVAQEVRQLAAQSRQAGTRIARQVNQMQTPLNAVVQRAGRDDVDPDASAQDIGALAEEQARRVVRAVAEEVGDVRREARELYEHCQQLHDEMHTLHADLKAFDRTGPAVEGLQQDMQRLRHWLLGADDPVAASSAHWLQRLDAHIDTLRRAREPGPAPERIHPTGA
jgi:methyl-accepting chemotaxis protein